MVSSSVGSELGAFEAESFASIDMGGMESLMEGAREASEGMKVAAPLNDRVVLYHPDPLNPSSVYVVPKNATDRHQALLHLASKRKVVNGKSVQWNNARPVVEPANLPLRCFVQGCSRAGGLPNRAALIAHVQGKHTNEAPLYQKLIDKLMELVYLDLPDADFEALGITPPTKEPAAELEIESAPLIERKTSKGA
jgi:hypothetical protein